MSDLIFISKDEKERPALDFRTLLAEGIASVQQLAGENWTDYNIHDPGVTILEQLCYAITELGYRTDFSFEDLLACLFRPQNINDTFYSAARILPCNPITINDYRKLLIDRIDGLRNVWIEPLEVWRHPSQIRGMYLVFAEASPDSINSDDDRLRLRNDIWNNLHKYSNLGEAFEQVIILDRTEFRVQADVEISYEADPDEVHAHVMYNLSRSMTRPMTFRSLESMMRSGAGINEIFEGPRLYNGFIKDSDLVRKTTILSSSTFVTPIKDTKGVVHIRRINASSNDSDEDPQRSARLAEEAPDTAFIDVDKIPVFGNKFDGETSSYIRYFKHNSEIKPDLANARRIYDKLMGKDDASSIYTRSSSNNATVAKEEESGSSNSTAMYNYRSSASYDLPVPQGVKADLGSYYSFQNHFPAIYGLGQMGVPASLRSGKREAIMALKGYLMLFDQILANYFAQLEHFSDLFSLDKELINTYFAGTIGSLDRIREMTTNIPHDLPQAEFSRQLQTAAARALAEIENFNERRSRFLDHLLARFGERTAIYGLEHFNYYYSQAEHQKVQLRIKSSLLAAMVKLAKNRARSFDYSKAYWGQVNSSIMEWKVKLLLGLDTRNHYLAAQNSELLRYFYSSDPFRFGEVFAMMHAGRIEPLDTEITELSPVYDNDTVNTELVHRLRMDADMVQGLYQTGDLAVIEKRGFGNSQFLLLFRKKTDTGTPDAVHKELIDRMLKLFHDIKNTDSLYWIPGRHNNYILEFSKDPDTGIYDKLSNRAWKEIGSFDSQEDAFMAGQMLFSHIRKLNLNSEGFYLVDHIHLRPRSEPEKYGIHFGSSENGVSLNSEQVFEFSQIQSEAVKLLFAFRSLQDIRWMPDKRIGLYFRDILLARSPESYDSEDRFEIQKELIIRFLKKLKVNDFLDNDVVQGYKPYPAGTAGSDYSFRVTVVLPDWTPRFSNSEFRQVLQNLFRLECPAHIGIDFRWLSFGQMLYFENIYAPWLDALRSNDTTRINAASASVLYFLNNPDEKDLRDEATRYVEKALGRQDCNCCRCTQKCDNCCSCTNCRNKS